MRKFNYWGNVPQRITQGFQNCETWILSAANTVTWFIWGTYEPVLKPKQPLLLQKKKKRLIPTISKVLFLRRSSTVSQWGSYLTMSPHVLTQTSGLTTNSFFSGVCFEGQHILLLSTGWPGTCYVRQGGCWLALDSFTVVFLPRSLKCWTNRKMPPSSSHRHSSGCRAVQIRKFRQSQTKPKCLVPKLPITTLIAWFHYTCQMISICH